MHYVKKNLVGRGTLSSECAPFCYSKFLTLIHLLQVGTITLLALTGLLIFMLFFLVATFNAIVISLLLSLAAAGGFLALFLAGVTAIYIGALSIAAFVISATAISTIIAILIATGRVMSSFSYCILYFFSYLTLQLLVASIPTSSRLAYMVRLMVYVASTHRTLASTLI